jgi:hypothetical protein
MWAERFAPGSVARLPEEAPAGAAGHIAAEAAVERTAAARIVGKAAAVDIAAGRIVGEAAVGVVAEHTGAAAAEVAGPAEAKSARVAGLHIPAEVVAREPPVAAEALPQRMRQPPLLARRKTGSRFWREEHRVRTADISS